MASFKTKRDVDKHVELIESKIVSESEKNLKGLSFAKLYFDVREFETAKKYLNKFLTVKENSASAHKLLGDVLEALGQDERALEEYRLAFDFDSSKVDIVFKACDLAAAVANSDRKFWLAQGEKYGPDQSNVSRLREVVSGKIPTSSSGPRNGNGTHSVHSPEDQFDVSVPRGTPTGSMWSSSRTAHFRRISQTPTTSSPRAEMSDGSGGRRFLPRPSPDRLAAQVHAVESNQDKIIDLLMEQNKEVISELRSQRLSMVEELKSNRQNMLEIKMEIKQGLHDLKMEIGCLGGKIRDHNVTVVNELTKVASSLPKASPTRELDLKELKEALEALPAKLAASLTLSAAPVAPPAAPSVAGGAGGAGGPSGPPALTMVELQEAFAHQAALLQLQSLNMQMFQRAPMPASFVSPAAVGSWSPQAQPVPNAPQRLSPVAPVASVVPVAPVAKETPKSAPKSNSGLPRDSILAQALSAPTLAERAPAAAQKPTDAWDKFKPKAGSWECPGCLLRQNGDLVQCPACQTAKPGHEDEVQKKEAASAPKVAFGPTGGFTFGGGALGGTQPPAQSSSSLGGFSFGAPIASASSPGFSFSVAKAAPVTPVPAFSVAPVGATTPRKSVDADSTGEPEADEHDHHDPHFEPIIPLPDLVEVTTGEEDEEIIFQHRAKVFRYDKDSKQWKERGIGDIKILKNPARNTFRVLLRRDQIHKIACNHLILPDMKLMPMAGSETSLCYFAQDFTEGEYKTENLAVKFKLAETKNVFKEKFEECQKMLVATPVKQPIEIKPISALSHQTKTDAVEDHDGEGDEQHDHDHDPHFEPIIPLPELVEVTTGEEEEEVVFLHRAKIYRFDKDAKQWKERGVGDLKILKHKARKAYRILLRRDQIHKIACNHILTTEMELKPMPGSENSLCWFANDFADGELVFENLAVKFKLPDTKNLFKAKFEECQKDLASELTTSKPAPSSSVAVKSESPPKPPSAEAADDDDSHDDHDHDPHFEPIIPLPELVQVTTGEEDEEVVFVHRAKIYRFDKDSKQWKERGVGDLKILRHPMRQTYRVLLRRDQILKIACNHLISADMKLEPMPGSDNALCWFAQDYSEGELRVENLAARFKTSETKNDFKAKFEECQKKLAEAAGPAVPTGQAAKQEDATPAEEGQKNEPTSENAEEEDEYDEDDDEDEDATMYERDCELFEVAQNSADAAAGTSLGAVHLRIMYDDDVYGARVMAAKTGDDNQESDDEEEHLVCNHIIAMQTTLDTGDLSCSWSALDFSTNPPSYRSFRAVFHNADDYQDFKDTFYEGKELAEQSEILELPQEEDYCYVEEGDYEEE